MTSRLIPKERLVDWARFEMGSLARPADPGPSPAHESSRQRDAAEAAGREAGYRAGQAEGRAESARLCALASALDSQLVDFEELHAAALADLALEIARQLLRGDLRVRRDALVAVVREAMAALPEGLRRPQIVLHPADVALVRAQLGDTLERGHWAVIEDHRMEPGGCRLESESGDVDATLATRWKRLAAALGRESAWDGD